jgi:hypothetical protein
MVRIAFVITILIWMSAYQARADEQVEPLAQEGDWVAFEHRPSITDPPDVCIAAAPAYHLALRTDQNDNELRYGNSAWSLPAAVTGSIEVAVNGHSYTYAITANSNTDVSATLSDGDLQTLVADTNVAASMTVKEGSSQAATVPLDGSKTAVTAYLTCANISQPGSTGGVNPFQ